MIPFLILGITADQFYLKAVKKHDEIYFRIAREIFPFDREIIVSEALNNIRSKIVNEKVKDLLKEALKYDPYSAEMLGMYFQYANAFGNKNDAKIAYKKLERIVPNSNILKEFKKMNPKGL